MADMEAWVEEELEDAADDFLREDVEDALIDRVTGFAEGDGCAEVGEELTHGGVGVLEGILARLGLGQGFLHGEDGVSPSVGTQG